MFISQYVKFAIRYQATTEQVLVVTLVGVLIVDKGRSVSPNVRLHVPSVSLPAARRRTATPETDLQLAADITRNSSWWQALRKTIRS